MSDADSVRFLTFDVGDRRYGIEVGRVQGVIEAPAVTPVPNATDAVLGVARLRGDVTVVLDGRVVTGGGPTPGAPAQAIILDRLVDGTPVAVSADAVEGMVDVDVADIAPVGSGSSARIAEAIHGGDRVPILGVEGLADLVEPVATGAQAKR